MNVAVKLPTAGSRSVDTTLFESTPSTMTCGIWLLQSTKSRTEATSGSDSCSRMGTPVELESPVRSALTSAWGRRSVDVRLPRR